MSAGKKHGRESIRDYLGNDAYMEIEARMTTEERALFLSVIHRTNPRLRGAKVADVLAMMDDQDAMLNLLEPFLETHGESLVGQFGPSGKLLRAATLAAATLQPTDMRPMVERLVRP